MKNLLQNIDISLLKTRLGELLIGGRGGRLQTVRPAQGEALNDVTSVSEKFQPKIASSTTSSPLYRRPVVLPDGIYIVRDYIATQQDSKSSALNAMTSKLEERMKDEKKGVDPEKLSVSCDYKDTPNGYLNLQSDLCKVDLNGGKKYDEAKPSMALLSPAGIEEEAKAMTYGAKKYGAYNWRKGIVVSRYISAALRHIFAVVRGEQIDPESGVHHFGHARANLGMALQNLEDHPELNDLYVKEPK